MTWKDKISFVLTETLPRLSAVGISAGRLAVSPPLVLVSIRYQNNSIDVVVQDDGVGITDLALPVQENSYLHYGMGNMRRQVQELGGSFEVGNGEEGGLTLRLGVPLGRWPA